VRPVARCGPQRAGTVQPVRATGGTGPARCTCIPVNRHLMATSPSPAGMQHERERERECVTRPRACEPLAFHGIRTAFPSTAAFDVRGSKTHLDRAVRASRWAGTWASMIADGRTGMPPTTGHRRAHRMAPPPNLLILARFTITVHCSSRDRENRVDRIGARKVDCAVSRRSAVCCYETETLLRSAAARGRVNTEWPCYFVLPLQQWRSQNFVVGYSHFF
jgi:hypothetical protein